MTTSQGIHHIRHIQEKKNNKISQNIAIEKQQMAKDFNFARPAARPYTGIGFLKDLMVLSAFTAFINDEF